MTIRYHSLEGRSAALRVSMFLLVASAGAAAFGQAATIDGVTFAGNSGKLFAPVREIADAFTISVHFSEGAVYLGQQKLDDQGVSLPDGTRLIPLRQLERWGVRVSWNSEEERALLSHENGEVYVRRGPKRVVIDKSAQELRAMQGGRMVMKTPISTGRRGYDTPNGSFTAGPYKARMHKSTLYDDAPMPYSVQVKGDIFIHGYESVPGVPASHGCIRLPLEGGNPAKFFYQWADVGIPIEINGKWNGHS